MSNVVTDKSLVQGQELSADDQKAILQKLLTDRRNAIVDKYAPRSTGLFDVTEMLGIDDFRNRRANRQFQKQVLNPLIESGAIQGNSIKPLGGLFDSRGSSFMPIQDQAWKRAFNELEVGDNFNRAVLQNKDAISAVESLGFNTEFIPGSHDNQLNLINQHNEQTGNLDLRKKDRLNINNTMAELNQARSNQIYEATPLQELGINKETGKFYTPREYEMKYGENAVRMNHVENLIKQANQPINNQLELQRKQQNTNNLIKGILGTAMLLSD
tara:strand:- start:34 stop:846 length:813 start_codon:yes stop_codon:yes gene_type:complete